MSLLVTSGGVEDKSSCGDWWCPTNKISCPTEIIALKPKMCASQSEYPEEAYSATGAVVGDTFLSCGGYSLTSGTTINTCYKLGSNVPIGYMENNRQQAASIEVGSRLWVTGGYDDKGESLNSTEFLDPSTGKVHSGPDLPQAISAHCLVKINSLTAMLIENKESWFHSFGTEDWVGGPYLNITRWRHTCGIIKDSDVDSEKTIVIAAGGGLETSTELFVIGEEPLDHWTTGPNLPNRIRDAAGVATPDGKSFLFIGGFNNDKQLQEDSIYRLQCFKLECFWKKLDQKLQVRRELHLVAFLSDSLINCEKV